VDKAKTTISALDPRDGRSFDVAVAGPAALLVAKLHKIGERISGREQRRVDDKDALDIWRLLQAIETSQLSTALLKLVDVDVARDVTREALVGLRTHFTDPRSAGPQMAARAVGALMSAEEVAETCATLAADLVRQIDAES